MKYLETKCCFVKETDLTLVNMKPKYTICKITSPIFTEVIYIIVNIDLEIISRFQYVRLWSQSDLPQFTLIAYTLCHFYLFTTPSGCICKSWVFPSNEASCDPMWNPFRKVTAVWLIKFRCNVISCKVKSSVITSKTLKEVFAKGNFTCV